MGPPLTWEDRCAFATETRPGGSLTGEVRHRELLPHRFVVAWIDSFFMEEDSKPECMRDGEFMLIWSETSLKLGLIGCIVVLVLEYAEVTTGLPEVILALLVSRRLLNDLPRCVFESFFSASGSQDRTTVVASAYLCNCGRDL